MNLAVKLFSEVINKPVGIPDAWPAEVIELGEGTELPGPAWTLMTSAEFAAHKATHAADYNAYLAPSVLIAAKQAKIAQLKKDLESYIDSKYPFMDRTQLFNLYMLAKFDSLTNRAAYLRGAVDWALSVAQYGVSVATSIQAQTNLANLATVTWDIDGNADADPGVTLATALAILD